MLSRLRGSEADGQALETPTHCTSPVLRVAIYKAQRAGPDVEACWSLEVHFRAKRAFDLVFGDETENLRFRYEGHCLIAVVAVVVVVAAAADASADDAAAADASSW